MPRGRLSDTTISKTARAKHAWLLRLMVTVRQRLQDDNHNSSFLLLRSSSVYFSLHADHQRMLSRRNRISLMDFCFNFRSFSNVDFLHYFRFCKKDLVKIIDAVGWPALRSHTNRNRYATNPALSCCVLLRRLSTPVLWWDMEELFGKYGPQLSEIFRETLENFLNLRLPLLRHGSEQGWFKYNLANFANALYAKTNALENFIGFIDGTVIAIARPSNYMWQLVTYNWHKKKHALKFQTVTLPNGLVAHVFGPVEGRRHDWTLYVRSELDETLAEVLEQDGVQYCIYGDSGYNDRDFLCTPLQGSNLSDAAKAYNKAMAAGRVTVEWFYKETKIYWPVIDFKRKMRVIESPVGNMYLAAMLLTNIRNCLYPNPISQYFNCKPPTLSEYLGYTMES